MPLKLSMPLWIAWTRNYTIECTWRSTRTSIPGAGGLATTAPMSWELRRESKPVESSLRYNPYTFIGRASWKGNTGAHSLRPFRPTCGTLIPKMSKLLWPIIRRSEGGPGLRGKLTWRMWPAVGWRWIKCLTHDEQIQSPLIFYAI